MIILFPVIYRPDSVHALLKDEVIYNKGQGTVFLLALTPKACVVNVSRPPHLLTLLSSSCTQTYLSAEQIATSQTTCSLVLLRCGERRRTGITALQLAPNFVSLVRMPKVSLSIHLSCLTDS